MNDYQMSSLAADRTREFQAEAQRSRLARGARPDRPAEQPARPRRSLRLGVNALLGRRAV